MNELGKPSTETQSIKESESENTVTFVAKMDVRPTDKSRNSSMKASGKTAAQFHQAGAY